MAPTQVTNPDTATAGRRPSGPARLSGSGLAVVLALAGLALVAATDQILPASSAHQAQLRIWLLSRAAGIVTLTLLAVQIVFGLVLSHPTNRTTWKLSKQVFPWHETLWVFVLAFVAAHVISIAVDPYAGVGWAGALIPGLSSYRTPAVAVGTLGLEALLVTGVTARWTRLLPAGAWLRIHRFSLAVFALAWVHGVWAGTDAIPLLWLNGLLAAAVAGAAAYRYWVLRTKRPVYQLGLARQPEAAR